jgi:hypothetical protein
MMFLRGLRLVAMGLGLVSAVGASTARADVVTDWNTIYLETVRAVGGPPCPLARSAAMMHVAMFDALEAIDCRYTPLVVKDITPPNLANRKAAIAAAAHRVLSNLYPARSAIYDQALTDSLAGLPNDQHRTDGVALGVQVADRVIADHVNDLPFQNDTDYIYSSTPGAYRPTFPDFTSPPFSPGYGHCKPWCMLNGSQFRAARGPLGYRQIGNLIHSVKYANQFQEVNLYGKRTSTVRTADQTELAWFWANDRNGTYKPAGHLNAITQTVSGQRNLNLEQNARLFAMINVAMADAGIMGWDQKFLTDVDLWRPITAIREAATDGNPLTKQNPNWIPLLDFSPPFPGYVSGHSSFAGAWSATMRNFFGTDNIAFSATSDEPTSAGVVRTFTSFSQAGLEDALSRIYLGVHFRMDCEDGFAHGTAMATSMASTFFVRTCRTDLSKDGAITTSDLTIFTNGYFAGERVADYNRDGNIDSLDAAQYMTDYLNGCN